jgi:hypothetical protein
MMKTLLILALAAVAAAPQDTPFNEKDFTGWKFKGGLEKSKWTVGKASLDPADPHKVVVAEGKEMVNAAGHSCDIYTEAKWADCLIEVDVLVAKGQNSGVYVMGEYEIQVLDSFGKEKVGAGDMGGIYAAAAPKVNASKAPGEWQKFVIDFRAPRFDDKGMKTVNAKFIKIELNGTLIHENVEMKNVTPGGLTGKEVAAGPVMYQGDHGIVSFRNLKVTPVK